MPPVHVGRPCPIGPGAAEMNFGVWLAACWEMRLVVILKVIRVCTCYMRMFSERIVTALAGLVRDRFCVLRVVIASKWRIYAMESETLQGLLSGLTISRICCRPCPRACRTNITGGTNIGGRSSAGPRLRATPQQLGILPCSHPLTKIIDMTEQFEYTHLERLSLPVGFG